ncbi:MAG: ABC transporter permease [Chloroflexi bacterium]|nr:ABC transporter permease [Chloroflexota bacterium]
MKLKFWLRWSYRDAREHWLQVLAIALILALGTGVYSGFGKQKEWRIESLDKSFAMLAMYDLHMELTDGSYLEGPALEAALAHIEGVAMVETRLLVPTLIDASKGGETILYPGRLVGLDLSNGGPHINKLNITEGARLSEADINSNRVVIDHLFTSYRKLSPGDTVKIAGDFELDFVGRGQTPENLMIMPGTGGFMENENTFAIMYMSRASVQRLSGRAGLVNDVVFLFNKNTDPDAVIAEINKVMAANFADTGFNLTKKTDDKVYNAMYTDARGDQRFWNIIAGLFLFGAAMATFNLAGRIVESQRRQIGIGMALGVKRPLLALRPILLGLQIALIGTIFGLAVGYIFSQAIAGIFDDFYPLPYWRNPFFIESYINASIVGLIVPVVATLFPVWRAVRVQPIDAIQTGYLVAKGGGLSYLMEYVPVPGKSYMQMPFRNILRSPWRSLLTMLGVSIAIMLLIAMSGILDTFQRTIHQGSDFYIKSQPNRLNVVLDTFYPINSERISQIQALEQDGQPLFSKVDVGLIMVGEYVNHDDEEMLAVIDLFDPETALWQPTLKEGQLPDGQRGIVISEKAADDLGVEVGDTVRVALPIREGLLSYRMEETDIPVVGIHDNPLRMQAYMSLNQADLMNMQGLANTLTLYPAKGVTTEEMRRVMFAQPGVASVQLVSDIASSFEEAIEIFNVVMMMIQGVVVILAFLIAFNSTSINVDERVREIATMFAFGLPIRTVIRMQVVENLITGLIGTILGVLFGYFAIVWMVKGQVADMIPDIQFDIHIALATFVTASVLGIVVVGLTPLLSIRKFLRMDIPSTLRVME